MIYFLPGMGATKEMYAGPWKSVRDSVFLDWPAEFQGVTISDLAEYLIVEHAIGKDDSLIGSSLGGIVACEILNLIEVNHVSLLGGAIRKEEVSSLLSVMHPLVDVAPMEFIRVASGKVPMELARMFNQTRAGFVRSMCKAIFHWDGLDGDKKVFRVHGRKDKVIPLPNDIDCILNGGHLIAMTHPDECLEALRANKTGLT